MTAIFTASWSALYAADKAGRLPDDVQPVRISRGLPRFWPAAARFPSMPELMPDSFMFGLDSERFRAAYLAKLDRIGVDAITAALEAIPGDKALACFEADPAGCHRRVAADWIEERTGRRVPEMPKPEPAQLRPPDC